VVGRGVGFDLDGVVDPLVHPQARDGLELIRLGGHLKA
jgi:hypothetical protein